MRQTFQRQLILEELQGTESHPRAGALYQKVREHLPTISFGTVYRNLRLLKAQGQIQELSFGNEASRWDGNTNPHYHFTCKQCGQVLDLSLDPNPNWEGEIAHKTGLLVTHHRAEFYGLCLSCQG